MDVSGKFVLFIVVLVINKLVMSCFETLPVHYSNVTRYRCHTHRSSMELRAKTPDEKLSDVTTLSHSHKYFNRIFDFDFEIVFHVFNHLYLFLPLSAIKGDNFYHP